MPSVHHTRVTTHHRPLQSVLLLLLALLLPTSLAQNEPITLTYAQSVAVTDLGPAYGAFLGYPSGYEVAYALYDRLVTFDSELNLVPQLATDWETSEDGLTWTFNLRNDVTFHDGTPFNAEAVRFNIERMMDPEINTTNRPLWDPIGGVKVLDEYTVTITTTEPYAMLLNTLAHGSGAVVSPSAVEANGSDSMTTNPVGAGPYRLESFNPGQEVVLTAFDDYWGGRPAVDRLVFRYVPEASTRLSALRAGSVDVVDAIPPQLASTLENDPEITIIAKPGLRPMGFAIMSEHPPLDDVRVRQALNYAVPREAIANGIFRGYAQAADSPLAFNTFGHRSIGGYEHDPEHARQLLEEAGWTDTDGDGVLDKDGEPLQLTMYTPEGLFPADVEVAEVTARSLQESGINVEIVKLESGGYWDYLRYPLAEIPWDLAMFGFNPSNADGAYHLDSLFTGNPDPNAAPIAWNITRYDNPTVNDLIGRAKTTIDPEQRAELLGQAQEPIWNDAPYIWLQVNEAIVATRSDVQGVEVWPIIFTIVRDARTE